MMYAACGLTTRLPTGFVARGRVDDLAVLVLDLEDHRPRHQHAAVGDRAVGAEQVDRVDLDRADRLRDDRDGAGREVEPELLLAVEHEVEPGSMPALIDGMLNENWRAERRRTGPALEAVGLGRQERALPLLPKSVTTSMNIVAAVRVWSSMPMM